MNELLRVPMSETAVQVECADGHRYSGRIFIPAASAFHEGPSRPEEWLNQAAPFFPFLADGASRPVLLNKRELVIVSVADAGDAEPEEWPVQRVRIETQRSLLEGDLVLAMPEGHLRVLDYLNGPEAFLELRDGSVRHFVRKERITRVVEVREE